MESLTGDIQAFSRSQILWLIPLFPLLGALINGLCGRSVQARFGRRAVHAIALGAMGLSSLLAIVAVCKLTALPPAARFLLDRRWNMLSVGALHVDLAFALDPLSAVMILIITLVGTLIHVYSTGYMARDPAGWRFFAYLNLFVFSMLVLVLGDSLFLMFFGWEGVGLCSYLLIGFWYGDLAKARAGKKAFITNRVGDWGFLVGLLLLFRGLGDGRVPPTVDTDIAGGRVAVGPMLNVRELHDQMSLHDAGGKHVFAAALAGKTVLGIPLLFLVGLALFLGIAGKSAQLPLHVWLPDAMAGPTPVSALIHAATMVTAGVYLIARLSFLFCLSPHALTVIAGVGLATALFGAAIAATQTDIKKVLAYSTISQLGFMFLAVGVGAYWVGVFHLLTHACFKACLFLAAGSAIHGVEHADDAGTIDAQDLRNMGGLAALMPKTHLAYLLGCVSIAGFPVAAGFYSKDEILWKAFTQAQVFVPGGVLWAIALLTAGLTAFYMFRSYYLAFWARAQPAAAHIHESPASMTTVLAILGAAAVVTGPLLGWPEAWGGHPWLERFLAPVFADADAAARFGAHAHVLVFVFQLASVVVATAGWAAARGLYRDLARTEARLEGWRQAFFRLHRVVQGKFFIDEAYETMILVPMRDISQGLAWADRHIVDRIVRLAARATRGIATLDGWFDRHIVDGAVNAVSTVAFAGGRRLVRLQTGRINNYVLGMTIGVVALVAVSWFIG